MSDKYKSYVAGLRDPIQSAVAVVPNDAQDLGETSRAIYVGGTGDVQVTLVSGDTLTFRSLLVGWHPIRVSRVWATGTTATDIVACS